jgi:hypothetical protein
MSKLEEVASYADHTFEAAQRALSRGELEMFRAFAEQHRGLADLFNHLQDGGRIQ